MTASLFLDRLGCFLRLLVLALIPGERIGVTLVCDASWHLWGGTSAAPG